MAAEVASTTTAVNATSLQIRTYGGSPILAEFSSTNGGYTASGGQPYLPLQADPYDAYAGNGNPYVNWAVTLDRAKAQAALGVGTLKAIDVVQRNGAGAWGGRVLSAVVKGTTATKTVTGEELRFLLGLRSSWIQFGQSPITKYWLSIGGSSSTVGDPIGYEWPVRGGTGQAFASGHIYWTSDHGARHIYGGFETRYQQIGGPDHAIGLPISGRYNGYYGTSVVQDFRNGRMYWNSTIDVREVYGPIYAAYYKVGREKGRLQLPVTYQYPVKFSMTPGAQQKFQGGYINWYASNNTTAVVYY